MSSTWRILAEEVAWIFAPLARAAESEEELRALLGRLGWDITSLPASYQPLAAAASSALDTVRALGDDPDVDEVLAAAQDVVELVQAVRALADVPGGVDIPIGQFVDELIDFLIIEYLTERAPGLYHIFTSTGVIQTYEHADAETSARKAYIERRFHFDELVAALNDPTSIPERILQWGNATREYTKLAYHMANLAAAAGLDVFVDRVDSRRRAGYQPNPEAVDGRMNLAIQLPLFETVIDDTQIEAGVSILELPGEPGKLPGIVVEPFIPPELGTSFQLNDETAVTVRVGSDIGHSFGLMIRPNELAVTYPFEPGRPFPSAGFDVGLEWEPAEVKTLLGRPSGTRLEVKGLDTKLAVDVNGPHLELALSLTPRELALVLAGGDQDGFVNEMLGGETRIPLPLELRWSSKTGLSFGGGSAFRITLTPRLRIGPVEITSVAIGIEGRQDPAAAALTLAANVAGTLGPVSFLINGLGMSFDVALVDGNLGPADVGLGFLPPTGIGLAIDAGAVSGGGFIDHDAELKRYSGGLALEAFGVAVNALGVLDTDVPGVGYSLVGIVSATFTPIQLGLGFTLNGVGGLFGVNRRIDVEALETAVFGDGLADIFFPDDLIAQADRIVTDLSAYFPPAADRYVFGPAAKIGWGTPTLVTADLAVLLEVPSPVKIVILGKARAAIPSEASPLILLNVDVLGLVDFEKKTFELHAVLKNSKVVGFDISGGLGMKLWWGDPPNFVLSVGGFNPRFQAPAGFRVPPPIHIPLGFDDDPRLDITGYLALTPNTAQIGASVSLSASAGPLNIKGHLGFDALFVWSPFQVTVDIDAGVSLRRHETVLAGVQLHGTLSGPGPWRVKGKACLSCWFFDLCVPFSASFGGTVDTTAPARNPWNELRPAIEDPRNWASVAVPGALRSVVLGKAAGGITALDPADEAALRQKVIPLDRKITRYQNAKPDGPDRYAITAVRAGTTAADHDDVQEWMAPDQFEDLSDDQRLSRGSYEKMTTGVSIAGSATQINATGVFVKPLTYETIELRDRWTVVERDAFSPNAIRVKAGAKKSPRRNKAVVAPKVRLADEQFVVVSTVDLIRRLDITAATSKGEAYAALAEHLAAEPLDADTLQVVPLHEAA